MGILGTKLTLLLVGVLVISYVGCGSSAGVVDIPANGNFEDYENIESFENRITKLKMDIESFYDRPQFKLGDTDPRRILTKNTERIAKISKIISYLQSEAGRLLTFLETKTNVTQDKKKLTDGFIDFIQAQITKLNVM